MEQALPIDAADKQYEILLQFRKPRVTSTWMPDPNPTHKCDSTKIETDGQQRTHFHRLRQLPTTNTNARTN